MIHINKGIKLFFISIILLLMNQKFLLVGRAEENSVLVEDITLQDDEEEITETEQTETTTSENLSYEEVLDYIHESALLTTVKTSVVAEGYLSESEINSMSDDIILDIIANFIINNGKNIDIASIANSLSAYVIEDTSEDIFPMTREEAEAYIDSQDLLNRGPQILIEAGYINQDIVNRLPEDAFYQVFIQQFTTHNTGGDPSITFAILSKMYPEIFTIEEENTQAPIELSSLEDGNQLPYNKKITLGEHEYQLKRIFILRPGEAGNQSENQYLLGIEYGYDKVSNDSTFNGQENWLVNSDLTQINEMGAQSLELGDYRLNNNDNSGQNERLSPERTSENNERIVERVYYELVNIDSSVTFTAISDQGVEILDIDIMTLMKLPPQSGVYYNSDISLLGYLFDFETLYMVFTEEATLAQIHEVQADTKLVSVGDLSQEALIQYEELLPLVSTDTLQLLEIDNVIYEVSNDMVGLRQVSLDADKQEILSNILMTFKGHEERKEMTNELGDVYQFIPSSNMQ